MGKLAYIKPTTAIILMNEKTNSASPYALTPNRLSMIIISKKIVTQTACEISAFQYWMVMDAATISRGSVTSHCKA